MGIVDRINNNLETLFDPENDQIYKSLICDKDGEIPSTITKPTDIDIGAIASEIEYFRLLSIDLIKQLYINQASGKFLKYQLEEYFASLRLEDETDVEWVQRTIATVFQQKVSRASIIFSLRPYSSQEPEITNVIQESAFADFSFADAYDSATFYSYTTIINDITSWSVVTAPELNQWDSIAYGDGVFVAVSLSGTNRVMRSEDYGVSWEAIESSELNQWRSIAYGNGVFVAVASSGTNRVMRSTDGGASWSGVLSDPTTSSWQDVSYGNGVFIAVASVNKSMRSTDDGVSWTEISSTPVGNWTSVAYGEDVFIAVASSGTNQIMRSIDYGVSWSTVTSPSTSQWSGIAYGNGVFVATAIVGVNKIMRSDDLGLSWDLITQPPGTNTWKSVTYGNCMFVSVSQSASDSIMYSTDDGLSWETTESPGSVGGWFGVTFGNGIFVSVAISGSDRIMKSLHSETIVSDTVITLPAIAETFQSSFFTIKITLYNTSTDDIWTVQNIIRKMLAAGISYILVVTYT